MRQVASFLLLGAALAASAADIWRWKDADGVVHYSDTPVPGAERVVVNRAEPRPDDAAPASAAGGPPRAEPDRAPAQPAVRYTRCAVSQPPNDEAYFAVDSVSVSLAIEPYLQPRHRVEVLLNGTPYADWPAGALSYTFTGLYRGSYTLAVRVLDANGRTVCTGPVSNFHLRQPSILSPQSPQRPQAPSN
jgi:hypothetical protein